MRGALVHSVAVAGASLASYWLVTAVLAGVHAVSAADDVLGGVWSVIVTLFAYRSSYDESAAAALSRIAATTLSLALCLVYLLLFAFHPVGLAVVIALGALVMTLLGRPGDVATTGVTSVVVLGVASLTPHAAWQQPILRLFDTAIGVGVALSAVWIERRLTSISILEGLPEKGRS